MIVDGAWLGGYLPPSYVATLVVLLLTIMVNHCIIWVLKRGSPCEGYR